MQNFQKINPTDPSSNNLVDLSSKSQIDNAKPSNQIPTFASTATTKMLFVPYKNHHANFSSNNKTIKKHEPIAQNEIHQNNIQNAEIKDDNDLWTGFDEENEISEPKIAPPSSNFIQTLSASKTEGIFVQIN